MHCMEKKKQRVTTQSALESPTLRFQLDAVKLNNKSH